MTFEYVTHDPAELRQLVFDVIAIDRGNVVGHGPVTEVLA